MATAEFALPTRPVPALDGLRAVAVTAVLLYHVGLIPGGFLGVEVFFVLSGFLITTLLLSEVDRTSTVDLRGFYIRRAARLVPAAYVVIVVASLLSATLVWEARSETLLAAICSLLYISNWLSFGLNRFVGLLNFTWTLSQEEQFYLFAPALLRRARPERRRQWALTALAVALVLMAARGVLVLAWPHTVASTYHNPIVNLDSLLVGVALALMYAGPKPVRVISNVVVTGIGGVVGMAVVVTACLLYRLQGPDIAVAEPLATAGSALVVIAVTSASTTVVPRVLNLAPLVWIGRRSYALYLVQIPLVFAWRRILHLRGTTGPHLDETLAVIGSGVVLAALSARFLETPIRVWARRRFPDRGRLAGSGKPVISG